MDGMELGKMVGGLGNAYAQGQRLGMERAAFPMKIGLMQQQQQLGQQQLQSGQMGLENQKKIQEYGRRFSEEFKANPNQDPYALKTRIAGELGLPEEVFKGLEEKEKQFKSSLETGIAIFKWGGKAGLKGWMEEHPELSRVVSIDDLPEDPVRGIVVKFPDGTEIKAIRDDATGKVEIVKPGTEGGFTLGPGQTRYGAGGEKIAEGPPAKPTTIPSAGNAVDLAIKRKFGSEFLQDPIKSKEADVWLASNEGRKAVQQARDDLTPPSVTFLQTGEGIIPGVTRGQGVGTVGKPTGLEKPLPSEQIVSEQQLGTLKDALNRVKSSYDPSYVGFIAGRMGKIGEKTVGVGEKASRFYSDLAQLRNTLVYLMSGKQINENEYERLKEQMPVETTPESTFNARMKNFEATLESIIENRRKAMGGYTKPKTSVGEETKTIGDKTYIKQNGKWYEK